MARSAQAGPSNGRIADRRLATPFQPLWLINPLPKSSHKPCTRVPFWKRLNVQLAHYFLRELGVFKHRSMVADLIHRADYR